MYSEGILIVKCRKLIVKATHKKIIWQILTQQKLADNLGHPNGDRNHLRTCAYQN